MRTAGRVPLARRNLFQERRRALLAVAGVAMALLLVLVLQGIFDGAMRQVTAYIRTSEADLFVSQQGVRTMHMSASALPPGSSSGSEPSGTSPGPPPSASRPTPSFRPTRGTS
jgi:putative ABC transport system permease protein